MEFNELHVDEPWLSQIKLGKKTVEGRKGKKIKYETWVGKHAIFYNNETRILVMIKEVRHYSTLYDYLDNEKLENVAPHINDYDEIVEVYHKFSTDEEIKNVGGFNGIVVEFVKSIC